MLAWLLTSDIHQCFWIILCVKLYHFILNCTQFQREIYCQWNVSWSETIGWMFDWVGFCGGEGGLGNVAMGGLLCLKDFFLFEVSISSTLFSFFTFLSNSFLNTSCLLYLVSFLFCFASISLSVCLLRVSSTPFFLASFRFFRRFWSRILSRLKILFWLIPWCRLAKVFH
ncbi:hypothetical protein Hanom_Chr01g00068821 [Helianthus anomalus]